MSKDRYVMAEKADIKYIIIPITIGKRRQRQQNRTDFNSKNIPTSAINSTSKKPTPATRQRLAHAAGLVY